jgi:hypothetical protein
MQCQQTQERPTGIKRSALNRPPGKYWINLALKLRMIGTRFSAIVVLSETASVMMHRVGSAGWMDGGLVDD